MSILFKVSTVSQIKRSKEGMLTAWVAHSGEDGKETVNKNIHNDPRCIYSLALYQPLLSSGSKTPVFCLAQIVT